MVTEVCAFYQRRFEINGPGGPIGVQPWLRREWQRSGLPLARANEACGVRNAATRKYLTADWLWYWPPGEMVERLAAYANSYGARSGWPYFSLDGEQAGSRPSCGTGSAIAGTTSTASRTFGNAGPLHDPPRD